MPKQTTPKHTRRTSGPYQQGSRSKPAMSTAAMNPPRSNAPSFGNRLPTSHSMPPPLSNVERRMPPRDQATPTSPTTPLTPGNPVALAWTAQDDEVLLHARSQQHGWSVIQRENFPAKTPNACRKRYERLVAKRRGSEWDDERVERVTRHYMELRERIWQPLALAVGETWEDVEKLCLDRGARHLLPTVTSNTFRRGGSDNESRASHDSHDEERLSIPNLLG
ncbi:hypothetical protein AJ80_04273 [Polytolypa hystricis UAMH7299]|uniref:Myb-like domain-containing protein n=1 Tax=Polytolypa hystricis (strain UAMH7299) TaxID=1447883 RepID=A0A2B7YBN2_POLH7|nr:hypothetical protein AJ80_04273 [Polytolypa hystricis UAMH7299]